MVHAVPASQNLYRASRGLSTEPLGARTESVMRPDPGYTVWRLTPVVGLRDTAAWTKAQGKAHGREGRTCKKFQGRR